MYLLRNYCNFSLGDTSAEDYCGNEGVSDCGSFISGGNQCPDSSWPRQHTQKSRVLGKLRDEKAFPND
jgi:hypothetical protein